MAGEPDPTPPTPPAPPPPPGPAGGSLLDQLAPHALKIMLGAAVVGLISMFLPAVTVSLMGISESAAVWRDWRGKLDLLGYVGVGVMAGMMFQKETPAAKSMSLACLITAGVVLLLALWLPASIGGGDLGGFQSAVSIGFGCYLNILAALALTAGSVIQAKKVKIF